MLTKINIDITVREEDDGYHKSDTFTFNDEEGIYKVKSMKKSKFSPNQNIEIIEEENHAENFDTNLYSDKEKSGDDKEKIQSGNIIFANLININFKYHIHILITCLKIILIY